VTGTTTVMVLVVDDDPEFVLLIRDLLGDATRANFVVESADSIKKGIEAVEKGRFDVILLDYKLPDGDGLEFLNRLEKAHIKVPVIVVTGHGDKIVQMKALEAGAVEYLSKGTFNAELLERTCIYAIGMQEKRNRNGSGPGVGVLIEQLVELTRDSVKAQTEAASETREMRREMALGFESLKTDINNNLMATEMDIKARRDLCAKDYERVIAEIQSLSKFRWLLDWIKTNTTLAIVIFVCLLLALALGVVMLKFVDVDKVKNLKDAATGMLTTPPESGWRQWVT